MSARQQNEPSIEQRILALEVSGKLADATTCYERILEPKIHHIQVKALSASSGCSRDVIMEILGFGPVLPGPGQR